MPAKRELTYAGYLQLDALLALQHRVAPASLGPQVQAAEHFFIVVHQAFELWFKQVLLDLDGAAGALALPDVDGEAALDHLLRVAAILRLLGQHMALFDHLTPHTFLAFRPYLGTASGSESAQFRAVKRALGLHQGAESPVYDAFRAALDHAGLTLDQLYARPARHGTLYRLAEALVDIAMGFWQVEAMHVQIVERMIGQRPGTAGTAGASFLSRSLQTKAFPDLWQVRTDL